MKIYLILYRSDQDDRCWDCGAGADNEYYKIVMFFTDKDKAQKQLEIFLDKKKHSSDYFYMEEYEEEKKEDSYAFRVD